MDLALDNLQGLICYRTQQTKQNLSILYLTLCSSKWKNIQKKLFMDERSFHGLPRLLSCQCILFQKRAVVSQTEYIPPGIVVLCECLDESAYPALYSNILWKIVLEGPQKVQFDWHSCPELAEILQFPSRILHFSDYNQYEKQTNIRFNLC